MKYVYMLQHVNDKREVLDINLFKDPKTLLESIKLSYNTSQSELPILPTYLPLLKESVIKSIKGQVIFVITPMPIIEFVTHI